MPYDFNKFISQRETEKARRDVDPVGLGNLYNNAIEHGDYKFLNIQLISENPLNDASMNVEDIEEIQDSIRSHGLLQPLTVYYNDDVNSYILIAGHRRYRALKGISSDSEVPCCIIERPKSEDEENELLLSANITRQTPFDRKRTVLKSMATWDKMSKDRRNYYRDKYLARFEDKYKHDARYVSDPTGFKDRNFRPKFDFIRTVTGIDVSDKTLQREIKSTFKENHIPESDDSIVSASDTVENETEEFEDEKVVSPDEIRIAECEKLIKKLEGAEKALKKFLNPDTVTVYYHDEMDNSVIGNERFDNFAKSTMNSVELMIAELNRINFKVESLNRKNVE